MKKATILLLCLAVLLCVYLNEAKKKGKEGKGGMLKLRDDEESDIALGKYFVEKILPLVREKWRRVSTRVSSQDRNDEQEESDSSQWPAKRCTNVQTSLNVRRDNGDLSGETLGPETEVTVWDTKQMLGETFAKLGYNRWVAARFLKMKCSPAPPVGPSQDCGVAYQNGTPLGRKRCVKIDGKNVVVETAVEFNKMKQEAQRAGITLRVNSGFRTQSEQEYFWNCYQTKRCNNGNLAARPGYSNHQNGIAVDINVVDGRVYDWLRNNASRFGFVRTVASETWHWELRRGSRCNAFVSYSCR